MESIDTFSIPYIDGNHLIVSLHGGWFLVKAECMRETLPVVMSSTSVMRFVIIIINEKMFQPLIWDDFQWFLLSHFTQIWHQDTLIGPIVSLCDCIVMSCDKLLCLSLTHLLLNGPRMFSPTITVNVTQCRNNCFQSVVVLRGDRERV